MLCPGELYRIEDNEDVRQKGLEKEAGRARNMADLLIISYHISWPDDGNRCRPLRGIKLDIYTMEIFDF